MTSFSVAVQIFTTILGILTESLLCDVFEVQITKIFDHFGVFVIKIIINIMQAIIHFTIVASVGTSFPL